MNEGGISQPLTTAVQIMLIDDLRSEIFDFDAVIGHSGGEIGAAYAVIYLTARGALCVTHYRGLKCRLATSPNGSIKLHWPTSNVKVRFNPAVLAFQKHLEDYMNVGSTCNHEDRLGSGPGSSGNVAMYSDGCSNVAIQVDQVEFKPVGLTANEDRQLSDKTNSEPCKPDGNLVADGNPVT